MRLLGIESSCDECAAAVVDDGRAILSSVVATQIPLHEQYRGVVPEIASRAHVQWISGVVSRALSEAGVGPGELDGIAATARPGLIGSLSVGLSFAKGMAWSLGLPFLGVNHMLAHLYAPQLEAPVPYPFIGLLVSGGHSIICRALDFDRIDVMGTTIDDAAGEAFDKVASFYNLGYPGGAVIDRLAERGDDRAFAFPRPSLHKGDHRYDLSYSGLKTAAIYQLDRYRRKDAPSTPEYIAASFRRAAIVTLARREFWQRINTLALSGVTVLVTTHFMEEAEYCDRLVIMASGRILSLGEPATIKAAARSPEQPHPSMEDAFIKLVEDAA